MPKKQHPPVSVRFDPEKEERYRAIAAEIGISFLEWLRNTLEERAGRVEGWIKEGRCYRDATGRLQFIDDLPEEEQERLAKILAKKQTKGPK